MAITVGEIVKVLTEWAPLSLKESWDNPGLLVGSPDEPVQKIMVTLDVMRDSVDYAVAHGVNLIVSHHPIIFSGIKALRSDTYDGEMYQKLLAYHISVYSAHTNLDSADGGVNDVLARRLGLREVTGLVPGVKETLYKVAVYVPESHSEAVRQAMAAAGAGYTGNYSDCSFTVKGDGRFKPRAARIPLSAPSARWKRYGKNGSRRSYRSRSCRPFWRRSCKYIPMRNRRTTYILWPMKAINTPWDASGSGRRRNRRASSCRR